MSQDETHRDPNGPPPGAGSAPRVLLGVSRAQPALARAHELSCRAAEVGFDWPDVSGVVDKIAEEAQELSEADDPGEIRHEYGDLLFALANLGRFLGVDPEVALAEANERFIRRFGHVEDGLLAQGRVFEDATLDEMEMLWQRAKELERA
jgi:nucleoside triphosphate diphosphatase